MEVGTRSLSLNWLSNWIFKNRKWINETPIRPEITPFDIFLMIIIATCSYTVRLWTFQYPNGVVFDEVHFGNFTNFYIRNEYFFDIHPPLAKLLFAGFAYLSEYKADIKFNSIQGSYYPNEDFIPLRITPIMFSSLTPVVMYLAVRFASYSKIAAFTGAMMFTFDTSAIIEGKYLLTDGTLHFFTAVSLACLNYWLSFHAMSKNYKRWMFIASIGLGCAISVKYTALSMCLLYGFTQIVQQIIDDNYKITWRIYSRLCIRALKVGRPALVFHILLWIIHVCLLPFVGEDSDFAEKDSLTPIVNRSQTNDYSKAVGLPPVILRALGIIMSIQLSNALNYKPHMCMTRPIDWPFLTDKWVDFGILGGKQIACVGNICVYVIGFAGVIALGFSCLKTTNGYMRALRFVLGYWLSYLPFFGVPRTMFLYHYLIPLMFACMCAGVALDAWLSPRWRGIASVFIIAAAFAGWWYTSPIVYGEVPAYSDDRIINPAWKYGREGRDKFVTKMQRKYDELKAAEDKEEEMKKERESFKKNKK